jgi:ParB-like nuclease domain
MQTQQTQNYDQFKSILSNREVDFKHVKKLAIAIQDKNLLHLNPITVNKNMEVVDGQHRLEAARQLNIPIYYIVDDTIDRKDISTLNSHKKNWQLPDYLNFWTIEGKEDYKAVSHFLNTYPKFPTTTALQLLAGTTTNVLVDFREGIYTVENHEQAVELANALEVLEGYCDFAYHSTFIKVFIRLFRQDIFSMEVFIHQIKKQQRSFVKCVNDKQYIAMLLEIYNYRRHEQNHISLK